MFYNDFKENGKLDGTSKKLEGKKDIGVEYQDKKGNLHKVLAKNEIMNTNKLN